jgi:hypothetical protein
VSAKGIAVNGAGVPGCRRPGCGHARGGHPSFIPDGDEPGYCASCGCWKYQPARLWTQILARFRRVPAPVTPDVLHQHPVRYPLPGWSEDDDRTQFGFRVPPYLIRPFTAGQAGPRVPRQRDSRGAPR